MRPGRRGLVNAQVDVRAMESRALSQSLAAPLDSQILPGSRMSLIAELGDRAVARMWGIPVGAVGEGDPISGRAVDGACRRVDERIVRWALDRARKRGYGMTP